MAGKVKIPLLGDTSKPVVYTVGIGALAVGGIIYYRYRKNAAANAAAQQQQASTSSGALQTDPAGNQCAELDPNTGYCPGTPEDQSAQANLGGNYGYGGGGGTGYGAYPTNSGELCPDGSYPTGYDQYGNPVCPPATGTGTSTATTNDAWLIEVTDQYPGWSAGIRGVLAGLTVTTAEKDQFLQAVALFGQPPGGYPSPIKTSDTSGHPGKSGDITVPDVTGQGVDAAKAVIRQAGLKDNLTAKETGIISSQSPHAGTKVKSGATIHLTVKKR